LKYLIGMLLRLNLLTLLLAFAMGREWCDYYFTPLVTAWSLFFYLLHTLGSGLAPWARLAVAALVAAALSYNAARDPAKFSFAKMAFSPMRSMLESPTTPFETFLFRAQLDSVSPLIGAAVALLHPALSRQLRHIEWHAQPAKMMIRGVLSTFAIAAFIYWASLVHGATATAGEEAAAEISKCTDSPSDACKRCSNASDQHGCIAARMAQEQYNSSMHNVFALIPILVFLLLRNLTPGLRAKTSYTLGFLGRRSLELYALQYHVFLADNAKGVLVVMPDGTPPFINAAMTAVGFLAAADVAHRCSTALIDGLLRTF